MSEPLPFRQNFGRSAVLDSTLFRSRHKLRANPSIELIVGQVAQFKRRFAKRCSLFVGILRNLG